MLIRVIVQEAILYQMRNDLVLFVAVGEGALATSGLYVGAAGLNLAGFDDGGLERAERVECDDDSGSTCGRPT